jgi:competence ComEA-like helix-hairpin-helix protein
LLTAAERRGALILVLLVSLGTCWDVWRSHRPVRGLAAPTAADSLAAPGGGALATPEPAPSSAVSGKRAPEQPVDLNRAGAAELARLPGIGPVLAARIVQARSERGWFARVEDLLTVRGIGQRLFERLRPHLTLGAGAGQGAFRAHAFRTAGTPDSVQILLQSRTPAFR